jgi:hypothetical protein
MTARLRANKLVWLLGLVWLAGCAYDDDGGWTRQTTASYLLAGETVVRHSEAGLDPAWSQAWGPISDLDGQGETLWLADAAGRQLLEVDARSGDLRARHALGDFSPHRLCAGERYLLLGDTARQLLRFWQPEEKSAILRPMDGPPGPITYRSRLFLVAAGRTVTAWHETALAPVSTDSLDRRVFAFEQPSGPLIHAYSRDSAQAYVSRWDLNGRSWVSREQRLNAEREWLSPFQRQTYGQEWLADLQLRLGQVQGPGVAITAEAAAIDFFAATAWVIRQDSLLRVPLQGGTAEGWLAPGSSLDRAWFFQQLRER